MTTETLYNFIASDLKAFTERMNGIFSRAADPFEVIELLGESPGKFRVILMWAGEEPAGESRRSGIVESKFTITVSNNRGLPLMKGANLSLPRGTTTPLMGRVAAVRDHLRVMTLPVEVTSGQLEYLGATPVKYEGAPLDAYELNFNTYAALPN